MEEQVALIAFTHSFTCSFSNSFSQYLCSVKGRYTHPCSVEGVPGKYDREACAGMRPHENALHL